MANNIIQTKDLIQQLNDVLSKHTGYLDSAASSLNKYVSSAKMPSEYVTSLKNIEQSQKNLVQSSKNLDKISKRIDDQRIKVKIPTLRQLARVKKQNQIANEKLTSSWLKLNKSLQDAERKYRNLAVSQGVSSRATIKARKEVLKLRKQHDRINKSIGVWNKNVGNYASGLQNIAGALGWAGVTFAMVNGLKATFDTIKAYDVLLRALEQVTDSQAQFASELGFLKEISEDYGLNLRQTTDDYVKFLASAKETTLTLTQQRSIFSSVSKASASLGLSAEDTSGTLRALNQIMSKGKVQAEELRGQLGDRIPGAFQIMAKALNVTTSELDEMLKRGEILADEVLPKFAAEMERSFGIENTERIETLNGALNRLSNVWDEFIIGIDKGDGAISKLVRGSLDTLTKMIKALGVATKGVSETQRETTFVSMYDNLKQSNTTVEEATKQLKNYRNAIKSIQEKVDKANIFQSTFGDIAEQKRSLGFLRGQADAYREYIKFLKEGDVEEKKVNETKKETNRIIKESTKLQKDNFGVLENTIPFYEQIIKSLKNQQKELSRTRKEWVAYQQQIDEFQGKLDTLKVNLQGFGDNETNGLVGALQGALGEDETDGLRNNFQNLFNSYVTIAEQAYGIIGQLSENATNKQLSDLELQKETALQFAGDSASARAEIERQYEERRAVIQRKQAEAQKKQALFSTLVNTAQGVVSALASTPPNVPLSILVGAIGAAQAAVIASQPIPQFWMGTEGTPSGQIMVNDDPYGVKGSNYKEVIKEPSGKLHFPQGKNVKMNVPKGSHVYSTYDAFMNSLDNELLSNNIMPIGQSNIMPMIVNNGLSKSDVQDVMMQHGKNVVNAINGKESLYFNYDERGAQIRRKKQGVKTRIMNARYSGRGLNV